MSRLLFWIGLIVLIVFAIRAKLKAATPRPGPRAGRARPEEGGVEKMSRCAHCGMYFPASEAVQADGLEYCSPAHVRLPPK